MRGKGGKRGGREKPSSHQPVFVWTFFFLRANPFFPFPLSKTRLLLNMSESGDKRTSSEPDSISLCDLNKKPKLDNNEPSLTTALPALSETLVLDKVQEDTINQLVQSSSSENTTTTLPDNGK